MSKLKTFEQFLADNNKQKPVQEGDRLIVASSKHKMISDNIKKKMWEAYYESLIEAIDYENDEDPDHTLEAYMSEFASLFGSTIGNAMDSGHFQKTLKIMAAQVAQGGDAEPSSDDIKHAPTMSEENNFANKRDEIKEYLDECIEAMKESFSKKLDEVKKSNNSRAIVIANMLKNNKDSNGQ